MLSLPLSFVDLETTGTSTNFNRIIEIGILKVDRNKVIRKYETLINPEISIDPFIQQYTGINPQDLENAPTFYDLKDEILEILKDSIFVAHNVRFDYGFIRNEFKRFDISFSSKHFCTVKLARLLYPEWKKYNLDTVIEKFKLNIKRRHRAFDDAKAIWHFYKKSQKEIKKDKFESALRIALKRPSVPVNLSQEILEALPESSGVYIFYGDKSTPLYIGKSLNIRDRVLSHFSGDHLSTLEMKISQTVKSIETVQTAGELGALLLESSLIKKLQPLYNRLLRNKRQLLVLKKIVNPDGFNTITTGILSEITIDDFSEIIGIFKSQKELKNTLHDLSEEYSLCNKLLGLEKTDRYCFAFHLGQCKGACQSEEMSLKYNLRFDEAFYKFKIKRWPFTGPIIVKEKSIGRESFIIDKWCILDSVKSQYDKINTEYGFDYDTYKIIKRYIETPKNMRNISNYNLSNY